MTHGGHPVDSGPHHSGAPSPASSGWEWQGCGTAAALFVSEALPKTAKKATEIGAIKKPRNSFNKEQKIAAFQFICGNFHEIPAIFSKRFVIFFNKSSKNELKLPLRIRHAVCGTLRHGGARSPSVWHATGCSSAAGVPKPASRHSTRPGPQPLSANRTGWAWHAASATARADGKAWHEVGGGGREWVAPATPPC